MKLDYDCIRYILISVENSDNPRLLASTLANDKYDVSKILYHIECLLDVNYLETSKPINSLGSYYSDYFIFRLTMYGHQFLDNIRNDTIWNKVKTKSHEVGALTLTSILKIAENIISNIISNTLS